MSHRRKVYVIDDAEAMRDSLNFLLSSANFNVTLYQSAQNFIDSVSSLDFGCVGSDVRMTGLDWMGLLKRVNAVRCSFPGIMMPGHGDVALAVEAMKLGAVDFLEKPFQHVRLIGMIETAIKQAEPD